MHVQHVRAILSALFSLVSKDIMRPACACHFVCLGLKMHAQVVERKLACYANHAAMNTHVCVCKYGGIVQAEQG